MKYLHPVALLLALSISVHGQVIEADTDLITLAEVDGNYSVSKQNNDTLYTIDIAQDSAVTAHLQLYLTQLRDRSIDIDMLSLYQLLLEPLEPLQYHLIILRQGNLTALPIAGLVKQKPLGHESYKQHDYLLNDHTLTYQVNVESYQRALEHPVSGKGTLLLLPDEESEDREYLKEIRNIRDDFGGEVVALAAQTMQLSDKLQQARIIHMSGVGNVGRDGLEVDGDILRTDAELLSIGEVSPSDQEWITRLIGQGTKAVLYRPTDDFTTSRRRIITRFYKYLFDGDRKQDAIRSAQLHYVNSASSSEEAHPAYWATWQLYGDVKSIDGNVPTNLYWLLIVIMIGLFILIKRSGTRLY